MTDEQDHNAWIDSLEMAMAVAGQKLAIQWGHQPWSDSWARLVAKTMLNALQEADEPFFMQSAVAGDEAVFCGDCTAPAGSSCDYLGHGLVTLGELMNWYANPAESPNGTGRP